MIMQVQRACSLEGGRCSRCNCPPQAENVGGPEVPLDRKQLAAEVVSRFRGHVAQQSSTDDYFVIRFGTEIEPPPRDLHGDHPYVDRLLRRSPRPQRRFLGV
jgi:hypothetical protein